MKEINNIKLKRKKNNTVTNFPGQEKIERRQAAKQFIEKTNKEQTEKFNFVRNHLDNIRKQFRETFNCDAADYYIFNSIKWE